MCRTYKCNSGSYVTEDDKCVGHINVIQVAM
jgi:hypothetical protein